MKHKGGKEMVKKEWIKNKSMFWTGMSVQILQFSVLGIWLLSKLDWSWLTRNLVETIAISLALALYNTISIVLIWKSTK